MIEVMVVLGIAAMLITMSVPFIGGLFNENPIRDTTKNVMQLLEQARAQAILTGQSYEFVIRPEELLITIRPSAKAPTQGAPDTIGFLPPEESFYQDDPEAPPGAARKPGKTSSASMHPEVIIETISVNYREMMGMPEASVRFHPNGTSDKFTFIFHRGQDEYRLVRLDMMTGLAEFETDPQKFIDPFD